MFFKNFKKWETEFAGRKFSLETGNGSALHGNSICKAQRGR